MTGITGLFFVILLIMLSGFIVTGFGRFTFAVRSAVSYPAGLGVLTLQMFFYSLAGAHFSFLSIAAPWVIIAVVIAVLRPSWFAFDGFFRDFKTRLKPLEVACLALIAFQIIFALVNSVSLPIKGFDTWVIWFLKGKAFYVDKTVSYDFFLNGVYSNGNLSYQYPLSIPLTVTLGYLGVGRVDDQLVKLLFSLHFVSLCAVLYHFMRSAASREASLVLLSLFVTVPRIMQQAGLDGVGYADLPLSLYFVCAAGFALAFIRGGEGKDFVFASFFLAMGAWVKNEGVTFMAGGFILLAAYAVYKLRRAAAWPVIAGLFVMFVIAGPWLIYMALMPAVSETMTSALSLHTLFANAGRLPVIIKRVLPKLFTANKYHLSWALYSSGLLFSYKRFKSPDFLYLNAVLFMQMCFYVLVYVVTTMDMTAQIDTSFDRLTIHLLPLAFLSIAGAWSAFFNDKGGAVSA